AEAAAAAAPPPTTPGLALARLVHADGSAMELLAVQLCDRLFRFAGRTHLDEAEATGATGGPIGDHRGGLAGPDLREQCFEICRRGVEGQVTDEELLAHGSSSFLCHPGGGRLGHSKRIR